MVYPLDTLFRGRLLYLHVQTYGKTDDLPSGDGSKALRHDIIPQFATQHLKSLSQFLSLTQLLPPPPPPPRPPPPLPPPPPLQPSKLRVVFGSVYDGQTPDADCFISFKNRQLSEHTLSSFCKETGLLYCIVLYCIVLHCVVLHCNVLHCIVLYCIVLYCIYAYI